MDSYTLEGLKWQSNQITWSFATFQYAQDAADFSFSHTISAEPYKAAITQAVQKWASVSGLTLQEVADNENPAQSADIRIGFGAFNPAVTRVLGETKLPGSQFFESDVVIRLEDPAETPVTRVGDDLLWDGYAPTFYQVALHEFGHALGLDHSTSAADVMFGTAGAGNRDLTASDIAGIQALYPGLLAAAEAPPQPGLALQGLHTDYVITPVSSGQAYIQDTVAGRDGTRVVANPGRLRFADGAGLFDPSGAAGDVARLYQGAFGRAPDIKGLEDNTALVTRGTVGIAGLAASFIGSAEFQSLYGQTDVATFVTRLYQNVLHRAPDAAGQQQWANAVNATSRGDALLAFSDSQENHRQTLPTAGSRTDAEATRLYQAAFNRTPDAAGLGSWSDKLKQGATVDQVAQGFADSKEFADRYGALNADGFVTQLYSNVLHRAPDAPGKQGWMNDLAAGASRSRVLAGFANSDENRIATAGLTHDGWVFVG